MGTGYFQDCKTVSEARMKYKKLLIENHPDTGGSEDVAKQIIAEFQHFLKFSQPVEPDQQQTQGQEDWEPDPFWVRSSSGSSRAAGSGTSRRGTPQGSGFKTWRTAGPQFTSAFFEMLSYVMQYNLDIEVIGNWIYVQGLPASRIFEFTVMGFQYSQKHKAYYWADWVEYKSRNHGPPKDYSKDDLRTMWGSDQKKKKALLE